MLCEPFKLCFSNISATSPVEYAQGIAKQIGVDMPAPPEFTGINERIPAGSVQDVMRSLGMTPKLNVPGISAPLAPKTPVPFVPKLPANLIGKTSAKNRCSQLTGATKAYCEKQYASSFADAESYYVRTA